MTELTIDTIEYLADAGVVLGEPLPTSSLGDRLTLTEIEFPEELRISDFFVLDGLYQISVDRLDGRVGSFSSETRFVVDGVNQLGLNFSEVQNTLSGARFYDGAADLEAWMFDHDESAFWMVTFVDNVVVDVSLMSSAD